MKVYVVRPAVDVFDGSGKLSSSIARSLDAIASVVSSSLRAGGDDSHYAVVWRGLVYEDIPPTIETTSTQEALTKLIHEMLDPNSSAGGMIRSSFNCRAVVFGQDAQALMCLRQEDAPPPMIDPSLGWIAEESSLLTDTDLFDGSWPKS